MAKPSSGNRESARVHLPPSSGSLEIDVARLRAMVEVLAQVLVDTGLVDHAIVEGKLRAASATAIPDEPALPSLKRRGLWASLFGRKPAPAPAPPPPELPSAPPPTPLPAADQTNRVARLPFPIQSLYDEPESSERTTNQKRSGSHDTIATPPRFGMCNRCWRQRALDATGLCESCAAKR
jgi:hypothetical protein